MLFLLAQAVAAEPIGPEAVPLDVYRCGHLVRLDDGLVRRDRPAISVLRAWHRLKVDEFARLVEDEKTIKRLHRRKVVWAVVVIPLAAVGVGVAVHGVSMLGKREEAVRAWSEIGAGVNATTAAAVLTRRMMGANTDFNRFYSETEMDEWVRGYNLRLRGSLGLDEMATREVDAAQHRAWQDAEACP